MRPCSRSVALLLVAFLLSCSHSVIAPPVYGTVTGSAVTETGAPVAGALTRIEILNVAETYSATTGGDGRFRIDNVRTGLAHMSILPPAGFVLSPDSMPTRSFTVAASSVHTEPPFLLVPLQPGAGAVTGRVLDGLAPVAHVVIEAVGVGVDTTQAAGGYLLNGVPPGDVVLRLHVPPNYVLATGQPAERTVHVSADLAVTVDWQVRYSGV